MASVRILVRVCLTILDIVELAMVLEVSRVEIPPSWKLFGVNMER